MNIEDQYIRRALNLGLVRFPQDGQVFRGRNGSIKRYLLDTRGAGSSVELREFIVEVLEERSKLFKEVEMIGGVSKSGTTWGAWLAWKLAMPFANILMDGPRSSGMQREVEGNIAKKKVILVDNWIRTGDSIKTAIDVCQRNEGIVVGVIAIASRQNLDIGVPVKVGWDIDNLLSVAYQLGMVGELLKE